jgi:hypothetical protein
MSLEFRPVKKGRAIAPWVKALSCYVGLKICIVNSVVPDTAGAGPAKEIIEQILTV